MVPRYTAGMTRTKRPGGARPNTRTSADAPASRDEGGAPRGKTKTSRTSGGRPGPGAGSPGSGSAAPRGERGGARGGRPGTSGIKPASLKPGGKSGGGRRPSTSAVQLDTPAPTKVFRDRDGAAHTFPDSSLKRVAAALLTENRKLWRYRAFGFPLFTDKGNEQTLTFDFYVYDHQEAVIRLILVVARETPELWDRVGRFKRQFPMYPYELWTPEKLAQLQGPRARLSF